MALLKWTMESAIAAVAVMVTTAGGLYSTVYQRGVVNEQITQLQSKTEQTDLHIARHDEQLNNIQQQNAAMKQSLDDIKDTVHDIQIQVRKPKHGDNQ